MSKKLKDVAARLRADADTLEQVAADVHHMAPKDVIRRFSRSDSFIVTESQIPDWRLGLSHYDPKHHVINMAAHQIGRRIAENIDFASEAVTPRDTFRPPNSSADIRFRSEVYVFTPRQLEKLVEEAMKIGRQST